MRLFATDLDGTLLDREGRIHPRDQRAIERAIADGVIVTIATGRLTSGTLHVAQALRLSAPIVCADGGVIVCGATEQVLERTPIDVERIEWLLSELAAAELASFVFTPDAIHSCRRGTAHHAYVRTWSPAIHTHNDVLGAAWRDDPHGPVMAVAIGAPDEIDSLADSLRKHPDVDVLAFDLGEHARAMRVVGAGVSKGTGLASVAHRLGIKTENIAVAGDWLNDVPMFELAGRSFAMPHAPPALRARATDIIEDEHANGAIARALEVWLAD